MNCREVPDALLLPDAGPELAAHLASCPGCAEVARQSAKLDAAWAATRPNEPNFERIWAGVESSLDSPATVPLRRNDKTKPIWRQPRLLLSAGVAASALIVAWFMVPVGPVGPNGNTSKQITGKEVVPGTIEPDEGQIAFFGNFPEGVTYVDLAQFQRPGEIDGINDVLNWAESVAEHNPEILTAN